MRPRIGIMSFATSASMPARRSAAMPRAASARLIERPPRGAAYEKRGPRSMTTGFRPRRASRIASKLPAGPPPTMAMRCPARSVMRRACGAAPAPRRRRRDSGCRAAPAPSAARSACANRRRRPSARSRATNAAAIRRRRRELHRELAAAPLGIRRRQHARAAAELALEQPLEITRQRERLAAQALSCRPRRTASSDAASGASDRIGGLLSCQPSAPDSGVNFGSMRNRRSRSCPHQPASRGSVAAAPCRRCTKQPPTAPGPAFKYL